MWSRFRKRSRTESGSQTESTSEQTKEKQAVENTQDAFAQTSNTELPPVKRASVLEASTSTSTYFVDRKLSGQRSNLSTIQERNLIDSAVNTSDTLFPVASKVSKVFVSASTQWEDDQGSSDRPGSIHSRQSGIQAIQPTTNDADSKDATVQTPAASTLSDASKSHKFSLSEKIGDWMSRKSNNRLSVSSGERNNDKQVQTSFVAISEEQRLPLHKATSTQEGLQLGDHQERSIANNLAPADQKGLSIDVPAPLHISTPKDSEATTLKFDKPVVIFPADKPGLFFMPGITNIPLLAPFPVPPFFPPPLPPPNSSFPMPPLGIKRAPLIQPLRQTKRKASVPDQREGASTSTESSQDLSQTLHKRKRSFPKGVKHPKKDHIEDNDSDLSSYLFRDPGNREETDSYIYTCNKKPTPAAQHGRYSGDEIPTQKRTFICKKHRIPRYDQTYTCTATDKSCGCQSDRGKVQEQPPVHGSQVVFCSNCQCYHCCLPAHTVVTPRCGFTPGNVCNGSLVGDNITHINTSMYRSVQVCLRNSNKRRRPKVKKYNFSIESIKMLGSLFSGARRTSMNYKEVNECQRRAECYCSQSRPQTDHAGSTAVQQIPSAAPCPCESSSSSSSLKPKGSFSSKFKSLTFGRHLKQLLTKFDKDLNDLPDRRTFQGDTDTDECSRVNSSVPNEEIKGSDSQGNGIKCSTAPSACRKSDVVSVFCDNDMFTAEKCPKVNHTCVDIQEDCRHLTRTKNIKCYTMSSGKPVCYHSPIHCCGCKCECCRIKENICMKGKRSPKNVCSVYSQTDIGSEKANKKASENNQDSSQLYRNEIQENLPPQEETNTPVSAEKQTRSSTTEEVVVTDSEVPKTDAHSEDRKPSSQPTVSDQNDDDNSNVSTIDEQQERSNVIDQEIIPETEIQSTDFSPVLEDSIKASGDQSKDVQEQAKEPEIVVKDTKTGKTPGESYTDLPEFKNENSAPRLPHVGRCRDHKHRYFQTGQQPEQYGSYEFDNLKPSIFCSVKRKSENKKDSSQEFEVIRSNYCDEHQENEAKSPCVECMTQTQSVDTVEDVEPVYINKPEEDSGGMLTPISEPESSQVEDSVGIIYAMSNNKFSKDTANSKLFRSIFSSQDNSQEQSTICDLPDLNSEILEMQCQQDRINDLAQLLRMQSSTNNVSQQPDKPAGDTIQHGDNQQLKQNNTFVSKNDCQQLKRNMTFTSKNDCEQFKKQNTFTNKNDIQEVTRQDTFTGNKCHKHIKRNHTFTSKNGCEQVKLQNTLTCGRKRKHHAIESSMQKVPCVREEKNTVNVPSDSCTKKHSHCTSKGDFVKPTHCNEMQVKQYYATKLAADCRNSNQTPASSTRCKTESKTFELPQVHRCNDCQSGETDILRKHDIKLPNIHRCKDCQNDEVEILIQQDFQLPNINRCKDYQNDVRKSLRKHDFQLPNVHRRKDCQNNETETKQQNLQLPNVHRCKDCQNDAIDNKQDLQLPNNHRNKGCQNEETDNKKDLQLPNIHRCKDCQNDKIDNKRQDLQLPNMPRGKYYQSDDIDILNQHELHIHKGYIYNRKHFKMKRENESQNVSVFCTIKKKQAKLKDMGYLEEFAGSKQDKMDHNLQDEHVHSQCRLCPLSVDENEDTESSDIDNATSLTPGNFTKMSKANKSRLIKETNSGKAEDSVGIGCAMSNNKDKTDGKLLSGAFSQRDNSHDQSTTGSLRDLGSEISDTRVQQNILKDISELLHRQANAKEDSFNQNYYDSNSGHFYFRNCFPTRCCNSVLHCNSSSKMQENRIKDRFDCSCTNLGHHLLVCRPCSRQFGPNHCLCRGKQLADTNHPSKECPHSDQYVACQCSSLENCRFGRYFIVKSNSNNAENRQNISPSYLDSEEASLNQSSLGLNTTPTEQASLHNMHSTQYQLSFACSNTEFLKDQTSSPSLAYFGNLLNHLGSFISPKLATYDNAHRINDKNDRNGEKHKQGGSCTIEQQEQGDNFTIKQHEQGSSFTISKIVTDSKTIRLCLEQGYKYNGHRSVNHREKCRKVHNRNATETGQEEFSSNISSDISSSKQDNDVILNSDNKRSQTHLGNTSDHESSYSEQGLFSTIGNIGSRSQRKVNKNDSKNSQRELCNNFCNESNPCQPELYNTISNDSCHSKPELCNHVSNSSNPNTRELSNISNESNRHTRELSTTSSNDNLQINKKLTEHASNINDISKYKPSSPVSNDSNISKQKQISIISNHINRSEREASNGASNHIHRTIKEKINCLLNHRKISKGNLSDTATNQNNEEINIKAISDGILHKQEDENVLSNDRKKEEQNDIKSNNSAVNNNDVNTFVNYISKRNKKDVKNEVLSESRISKQEESKMFNNEKCFSRKETNNADGTHKIKRRTRLCCPEFNSEERSHRDPSYMYFDQDAQSHKDSSYTDSNHYVRSHTDPCYTHSNHDVRNHSDCSQDTNRKYRRHTDSNDALLNYKDKDHKDLSDPDHRQTHRKHTDQAKEDQSRKEGKQINPSNAESNYKDRMHNESSDAGRKRNSTRHKELSDAELNFKDRRQKESSNAKSNYKEKGHKESSDAKSNHKLRKNTESSDVEPNFTDRRQKESNDAKPYYKNKRHKESSDAESNPKLRRHATESSDAESNPKLRRHIESSNVELNPKDSGYKESRDVVPSHKSRKHKDPNYVDALHEKEKDKADTGQGHSSPAQSNHAQHSHDSCTVSYSLSLSDTGERPPETHSNIKCTINQTGWCVQTETLIIPFPRSSFNKTSSSSHTEDGLERTAHETPCSNCHYRKKRKHNMTVTSDEEASVNSKKFQPLRKEFRQICEGPCFNCAHPQVKEIVAQETNYRRQNPVFGSVPENKSSPICFSDSQDFPNKLFTSGAPQKPERKLQTNTAQSYKWQPKETHPHPHSSDSSELQISRNSLCQDKGKLCLSRNRSPKFFSDSSGSSGAFNCYPKCRTRETFPAFSSQCQNLACQHDSYMGVRKEQSSSHRSPSYSQCVNNTSKESPESSQGTGGFKTNSRSCSFRLYNNMLPCQTCGQIKSDLIRQNCCEISCTSVV